MPDVNSPAVSVSRGASLSKLDRAWLRGRGCRSDCSCLGGFFSMALALVEHEQHGWGKTRVGLSRQKKKRTVAALLELPSEELSPMAESVFLSFSFFRTLLQWRMFFTDMLLLGYLSIQECHRMLEKSHSSLRSGYIVISKLEACSYEASWMFCASNCVIASEISFSAPRTYVSKCLDYYHKMKRRRD